MQSVVVLALLVASTQAFLFGPGGLFGGGAPAGGCDPCAAAHAAPYYPPQPQQPYYPPQQPLYQPPQPAYQPQPHYQQPSYNTGYQTAQVHQSYQQPAPVQNNYQTSGGSGGSGGYAQPPPPPPPSSYATGPAAGYKRFH